MANVDGSFSAGQIDALRQSGIEFSPDSAVGKAFNGKTVIIIDPTLTEGLRGTESDHEAVESKAKPSVKVRERTIAKAEDHETSSIRFSDLVPKKVKKGAGRAKKFVSTKAHDLAEYMGSKAQQLKSKTAGNLLRAVRHEGFREIKPDSVKDVKSEEFHVLVKAHNEDLQTLGELKGELKEEGRKVKEFENQYKDALELLDNPEKFTSKTKKTVFVMTPDGERKIESLDTTSRREDAQSIADEFRESEEFQEYQAMKMQQRKGGTETFKARQELKSQMKSRVDKMLELQAKELEEAAGTTRTGLKERREKAQQKFDDTVRTSQNEHGTRLEEARTKLGQQREELSTARKSRSDLKGDIKTDTKEARGLERDAYDTHERAKKSRTQSARTQHGDAARELSQEARKLRKGVEEARRLRKGLKAEVSEQREAKNKTKQEFQDLESGKALKKTKKKAQEQLKTEEKEVRREEKELEQQVKKKAKKLRSQLGKKRF